MGRQRKRALYPIALSPEAAAEAIGISARQIRAAIFDRAELPAFRGPNGTTRILVVSLTDWIQRTWPRATIARQIKRMQEKSP